MNKEAFIQKTENTLRFAALTLSLLSHLDITGTTTLFLEGTATACKVLAWGISAARKRGWFD
jgi:hypothetical protein